MVSCEILEAVVRSCNPMAVESLHQAYLPDFVILLLPKLPIHLPLNETVINDQVLIRTKARLP